MYIVRKTFLLNRNIAELKLIWSYYFEYDSNSGTDRFLHTIDKHVFSESNSWFDSTNDSPIANAGTRKRGVDVGLEAKYTVKYKKAAFKKPIHHGVVQNDAVSKKATANGLTPKNEAHLSSPGVFEMIFIEILAK